MKIHIIPSGSDKTLCGEEGKGTSLALDCNCNKCMNIARNILHSKNKNGE